MVSVRLDKSRRPPSVMRADVDQNVLDASAERRRTFWSRVTKTKSCWLYRTDSRNGYAAFYIRPRVTGAHRVALLWHKPPQQLGGLLALHKCRAKNCVRPSHLYWGTNKDNSADKKRDGTGDNLHCVGEKNHKAKITARQVVAIFKRYKKGNISCRSLGEMYGISGGSVRDIVKQKNWRSVTAKLAPVRIPKTRMGYSRGEKSPRAALTNEQASAVKVLLRRKYAGGVIADMFGVSPNVICGINSGRTYVRA